MSIDRLPMHAAGVHPRWTRREMLARVAGGVGALGVVSGVTHFPAKAKRLIYIVLNGGMSQVDTFDPKPMLTKYNGQPMPGGAPKTERATGMLMQSPFEFQRSSKCGTEVSEIFPRLGKLMDDCCVIRSMHTDVPNHEPSLFMINCGAIQPGRPSLGSWLMYGLGTENKNLPGFVVLCPGVPVVGPPLWSSAFLPAVFQGTFLKSEEADPYKLIRHVKPQADAPAQRRQLDLLARLNREHLATRGKDTQLEGSIEAMETAFRMQTEAPDAFDVRKVTSRLVNVLGITILAGVVSWRGGWWSGECGWCRFITATVSLGITTKIFWYTAGWRRGRIRVWLR